MMHSTDECSTVASAGLATNATTSKQDTESPVDLIPASQFTIDELADAYNQARVDYIVPMPMNARRLQKYIDNYDIDLNTSVVAMLDGDILGLSMLGVREDRTWVTRLGVLPHKRRRGIGQILMEHHIDMSDEIDVDFVRLEVIKNNVPAHQLFRKLGFEETRDLVILRRPPGPFTIEVPPYDLNPLGTQPALHLLKQRSSHPAWKDEVKSLQNIGHLAMLCVELEDGGRGWIAYQNTALQLSHLVLETQQGDPHDVGRALLHALHTNYPIQDTKVENIPVDSPHLPAFEDAGYVEAFRRIEMELYF